MAGPKPPPPPQSAGSGPDYLGVDFDPNDPQNYTPEGGVGFTPGYPHMRDTSSVTFDTTVPYTADAVVGGLQNMSVENLARLQLSLARVGLIGPSTGIRVGMVDPATINGYRQLLEFANRYHTNETVALAMLENAPEGTYDDKTGMFVGDAQESQGPVTTTNVSKSFSFTNPAAAKATVRQAMESSLGRAPTDREYRDFVGQLHAEEKASPTVTKTTTTRRPDGNTTSSSTTTPSDAPTADVAADQMLQDDYRREMGTYREATDYYQAAMNEIMGAGSVA